MPHLAANHYGKSRVRLVKVTRSGDTHHLHEWTVGVYLTGDFTSCYTTGDNTGLMATDTMKNTVYAVARTTSAHTPEDFASELAAFLLPRGGVPLTSVRVTVSEKLWVRLTVEGHPHGSAFLQRGPESNTASVTLAPGQPPVVISGIHGLVLLKTSHSAFAGFHRDELTTLPETHDRLLGTEAVIEWPWSAPPASFSAARETIREALLATFARHDSLSVQQTLFAMGDAALAAEPLLPAITLTMPNRHNIPFDFSRFTPPFQAQPPDPSPNLVFIATDEPHGHIHATVTR